MANNILALCLMVVLTGAALTSTAEPGPEYTHRLLCACHKSISRRLMETAKPERRLCGANCTKNKNGIVFCTMGGGRRLGKVNPARRLCGCTPGVGPQKNMMCGMHPIQHARRLAQMKCYTHSEQKFCTLSGGNKA